MPFIKIHIKHTNPHQTYHYIILTTNFYFFVLTAISAQTNEAASPSQDLSGIFKHEKRFSFDFALFLSLAITLRKSVRSHSETEFV